MVPGMRRWRGTIAFAAILLFGSSAASLAMDQQKHDDIKALLDATDAFSRQRQVIDVLLPPMFDIIKKSNPSIPPAVVDDLRRAAKDELDKALPELVEPTIAVYDVNFTDDEIKQLLAFYKSPIGRKYISQLPQVIQQSMAVGQVWGKAVAERLTRRITLEAKNKGLKI